MELAIDMESLPEATTNKGPSLKKIIMKSISYAALRYKNL
jgi:hypothetical protein